MWKGYLVNFAQHHIQSTKISSSQKWISYIQNDFKCLDNLDNIDTEIFLSLPSKDRFGLAHEPLSNLISFRHHPFIAIPASSGGSCYWYTISNPVQINGRSLLKKSKFYRENWGFELINPLQRVELYPLKKLLASAHKMKNI